MLRRIWFLVLVSVAHVAFAQQQKVLAEGIHSLQVTVDGDPLQPLVIRKGGKQHVHIEFDEMSHEYHRYIYHLQHCNADWTETDQLFESDFLSGLNDQPIEDYENSYNTTQLYTHYSVVFPNEDTRMLLSGNYRVTIYEDGNEEEPIIESEFCVLDPEMSISAQVSSNTDIDFQAHHQQLSYAISYGAVRVIDPLKELYTVVRQNRRYDNQVVNLAPNIRKATGVEYTYQRQLIFPATAEYHKFEVLDVHKPGMNVDRIRWYDPWYHVALFPETPQHNYSYSEDQNGAFVLRNTEGWKEDEISGEYMQVHFLLHTDKRLPGGDVYVCGRWTNPFPDEALRMEYDEQMHCYEAVATLKQGYYNYQFRQLTPDGKGTTRLTEGDFYQTENEYMILVYHRSPGGRYDRLVAFKTLNTTN